MNSKIEHTVEDDLVQRVWNNFLEDRADSIIDERKMRIHVIAVVTAIVLYTAATGILTFIICSINNIEFNLLPVFIVFIIITIACIWNPSQDIEAILIKRYRKHLYEVYDKELGIEYVQKEIERLRKTEESLKKLYADKEE